MDVVKVVYSAPAEAPQPWARALAREAQRAGLPEVRIYEWPDVDDALDALFAFLWNPAPELFARMQRLEVLFSLGAGVDHLLRVPSLPADLPIVRMVDPGLTTGMSEYVLFNVLRFQRRFDEYERMRSRGEWRELAQRSAAQTRVGIMGAGVLGADAAALLVSLGYDVALWSRSGSAVPGSTSFAGADGLSEFLARSDILVCLLPLNDATRGIIDANLLGRLPSGAFVINCGRGGHVVEADLLHALDSHQLAGAALDVFASEPLPPGHRLWTHDRAWITPHVASLTIPDTGAAHVIDGIRRHLAGEPLLHVVDRERGY